MADGKRREQWIHTSHLLAELMNGARTRKDKQPWTSQQLDPFYRRSEEAVEKVAPRQFIWSAICSML